MAMTTQRIFIAKLFFHLAANHSVLFIILPNIIFTTMSFGQCYLDFEGGERLSYAGGHDSINYCSAKFGGFVAASSSVSR